MSHIETTQNRTRGFLLRKYISTGLLHIVLTIFSLSLAMPFVWMALTGFKTLDEVGLESWIPNEFIWSNYVEVFETEGCLLYTSPSPRDRG